MKDSYLLNISPEDAGKRLDVVVLEFAQHNNLGLSRTGVQKLIAAGNLRLVAAQGPGGIKPHHKVKSGDKITFSLLEKTSRCISGEDIPLDIVYEDNDLAVINKKSGLVVHPAPGNYEHTLVNAIIYLFKELSDVNPQRPGIVHRLDKDTSGLLVVAKNNTSHLDLAEQFSRHTIKRKYAALVEGKVEFDQHVIELPIGRNPRKRESMSVGFGPDSRYARTSYRTLKRGAKMSLLELEPFTGRTHQLRVHLKHIGHPIIGDAKYGSGGADFRLALHAFYLGFIHPVTKKFVEFSTAIPQEFLDYLK